MLRFFIALLYTCVCDGHISHDQQHTAVNIRMPFVSALGIKKGASQYLVPAHFAFFITVHIHHIPITTVLYSSYISKNWYFKGPGCFESYSISCSRAECAMNYSTAVGNNIFVQRAAFGCEASTAISAGRRIQRPTYPLISHTAQRPQSTYCMAIGFWRWP